MEAVAQIAAAGGSDDELRRAVYSAGRAGFVAGAARGFARCRAARGDLASAAEIVRLQGCKGASKAARAWCGEETLALARRACSGRDMVRIECEAEDEVLLRADLLSGDDASVTAALLRMMAAGDTREALVHARVVGIPSPSIVFDAVLAAPLPNRAHQYAGLLRSICHMAGADREARRALVDSAVALGAGDLTVRPPRQREAQGRLRMLALYSAPLRARREGSRRPLCPGAEAETRCLDVGGPAERDAPAVEVLKAQ